MNKLEIIRELVEESTAADQLTDKLEELTPAHVYALYAMIVTMKGQNIQRAVIRYNLVQDIATLLSGVSTDNLKTELFCRPFLEGLAETAL